MEAKDAGRLDLALADTLLIDAAPAPCLPPGLGCRSKF
jgi:hypothetical protein